VLDVAPKDTMDLTGLVPALLADPAAARAVALGRRGRRRRACRGAPTPGRRAL